MLCATGARAAPPSVKGSGFLELRATAALPLGAARASRKHSESFGSLSLGIRCYMPRAFLLHFSAGTALVRMLLFFYATPSTKDENMIGITQTVFNVASAPVLAAALGSAAAPTADESLIADACWSYEQLAWETNCFPTLLQAKRSRGRTLAWLCRGGRPW